jgi:hypothetical protein
LLKHLKQRNNMGMWEILEEGRGEYDRDFGMRGGNPMEEAYREGCRYGYEKAMREIQGGEMGYRNSGGSRGGSYSGGSDMGERRMPGYFPEYPVYSERRGSQPYGDDMGERRRRRANGEFM